jgi:hypothetical protein
MKPIGRVVQVYTGNATVKIGGVPYPAFLWDDITYLPSFTPTIASITSLLQKPHRERTEQERAWAEANGFDGEPWSETEARDRAERVLGGVKVDPDDYGANVTTSAWED